jgi:hypothetical protein
LGNLAGFLFRVQAFFRFWVLSARKQLVKNLAHAKRVPTNQQCQYTPPLSLARCALHFAQLRQSVNPQQVASYLHFQQFKATKPIFEWA